MEFRNRLKAIRKERGLTQRELADIIKSNNNTVSNWEKGVSRPTTPVVEAIARALNVSVFDLFGDFTVADILSLSSKDAGERTPEEEMTLAFANPLLSQVNIYVGDALSSDTLMLDIREIESSVKGFCWESLLDNGGKELILAYDYMNNQGKKVILDIIAGLLRVPAYLEEGEAGIDKEQIGEIIHAMDSLRGVL